MGVAVAAPRHQLASNTMQPAACSYRRHPWLWIAAALVLVGLILLITLCAVLLGQGAPSFVFGPWTGRALWPMWWCRHKTS